jgi:hypothetical protein
MNKINYNNITYNNENIDIEIIMNETKAQFAERLKYIKKLEKANISWKEANRLSVIWYYIKYLNCKYNKTLYNKIISFEN